jgi:hypothetical protein
MAEHKILGKKTIAEEMWFWSEESEEIFGGGLENAVTLGFTWVDFEALLF